MTYIQQNGSLNLGLRIERGFALLATVLDRAHGGKAQFSDYLPDRTPEVKTEQVAASAQDIFSLLKAVKR
jgi:hypothetical protein